MAGFLARSDVGERARGVLEEEVARCLDNRLRVAEYTRQHTEIRDTPIEAPVVVLGMPRTGTTAINTPMTP